MPATRYYRKVIKITGEHSPNVRRARAMIAAGREPTGEVILPGVLPWNDYCKRRAVWDKVRQTIGLDAEFYEGAENLLYPPDWRARAEQLWRTWAAKTRRALAVGVDPAEGGDKTSMCAVDGLGMVRLSARQTPNTDDIPKEVLAFCQQVGLVDYSNLVFDRGGGGKQHADRLRGMRTDKWPRGVPCRTVAFGEAVSLPLRRVVHPLPDRAENVEERYIYKNRRAEMYGDLRLLLDPTAGLQGFGGPTGFCLIPDEVTGLDLSKQLAPIPLTYDPEGRLELPPKNKRPGAGEDTKVTLVELIGHSPDEADALVLAVHGLLHKGKKPVAGALRTS